MNIDRVGHATVLVTSGNVTILMDPVLANDFESGANVLHPPVDVDVDRLNAVTTAVLISHRHMDHFCIRSLAMLRRDIPVLYPKGDKLISACLRMLGFTLRLPVACGRVIRCGDLSVFPTPSRARFPEIGALFVDPSGAFWNMVDTVVEEAEISQVRALANRIHLLFAKYQPLVEEDLLMNALGSHFPVERYSRLLRNILATDPDVVVAGSCGYRFLSEPWLDDRAFPVSERRFIRDLSRMSPRTRAISIPHCGGLRMTEGKVHHSSGPGFATAKFAGSDSGWRPDRGVPPLSDANPYGYTLQEIKAGVRRFVASVPRRLMATEIAWCERMRMLAVIWGLEIIYPDGSIEQLKLDLSASEPNWSKAEDEFDLLTSICASTLLALVRGDCNAYSVYFNKMRVVNLGYITHAQGASLTLSLDDEPVTRLLLADADSRYALKLARELRKQALPQDSQCH